MESIASAISDNANLLFLMSEENSPGNERNGYGKIVAAARSQRPATGWQFKNMMNKIVGHVWSPV